MRIKLTAKQIQQIRPFYDRVQTAAIAGNPGMLVAQVRWDPPADSWWMEPGFLDHDHAKLITEKAQDINAPQHSGKRAESATDIQLNGCRLHKRRDCKVC